MVRQQRKTRTEVLFGWYGVHGTKHEGLMTTVNLGVLHQVTAALFNLGCTSEQFCYPCYPSTPSAKYRSLHCHPPARCQVSPRSPTLGAPFIGKGGSEQLELHSPQPDPTFSHFSLLEGVQQSPLAQQEPNFLHLHLHLHLHLTLGHV